MVDSAGTTARAAGESSREGADGTAARVGERTYAATPGELPEGTLVELFLRAIDEFDKPDAVLRWTGKTWEQVSHRQVLEDVRALYEALASLGVQRNDPVG